MSQKNLDVKVPGATAETSATETVGAPEPAGNVTLTAEQFAQLMAQAAGRANPSKRDENLPTIESLDLNSITKPVLTTTGWYVPEKFGSNPAQRSL